MGVTKKTRKKGKYTDIGWISSSVPLKIMTAYWREKKYIMH